jgi:hypothetical protein
MEHEPELADIVWMECRQQNGEITHIDDLAEEVTVTFDDGDEETLYYHDLEHTWNERAQAWHIYMERV